MKELLDRIVIDSKVMVGKPVIRGTRIPVYLIVELFAGGYTKERILEAYPTLKEEDITAALWYAAVRMKNEEIKVFEAEVA